MAAPATASLLQKTLQQTRAQLQQSLLTIDRITNSSLSSTQTTPPNSTAHSALKTILTYLRQNITSLSLAFSGKSITLDAAISQLAKVALNADQAVACLLAVPQNGLLQAEWSDGIREIVRGLLQLTNIFATDFSSTSPAPPSQASSSSRNPPPAPYLLQTNSLWTSIDHILSHSSSSEVQAAQTLFRADGEGIEDALREYKELLEEDEGVGGEEDEEMDGGEWAELERELGNAAGGASLSDEERDRIKSLDMILRLSQGIHKRSPLHIFPLFPPTHPFPPLIQTSHALSSAADTLVSDLYAPQDPLGINEAAEVLVGLARELWAACEVGLGEAGLEAGLGRLRVGSPGEAGKMEPVERELKWLGLWKIQMDKQWGLWEVFAGNTGTRG